MFDPPSIRLEIKRRLREVYRSSLYFLLPFALTTLGAWAHAPRWYLVTTFLGMWVGLVIWMVRYFQLSRCPACNALLMYLFQLPMPYDRCPYCHAPFK
jgi:hypothetical protein